MTLKPAVRIPLAIVSLIFGISGIFWLGQITAQHEAAVTDPCEAVMADARAIADRFDADSNEAKLVKHFGYLTTEQEQVARIMANNPSCFSAASVAGAEAWIARINHR